MKKALTAFWKQTTDVMSNKPSIDEMTHVIKEIAARLSVIEDRLPAIGYDGVERLRVIEHGSPEELIALDQEVLALQAEETQLRYRTGELHRRRRRAQVEEGIRNAPTNRKKLAGAVEEALKAERIYLRARSKAAAITDEVSTVRINAREETDIDNSDCWLETADLVRLGKMLYPGEDQSAREHRFQWAKERARTIRDCKAVAIGDDSDAAIANLPLYGSLMSPARQLS